MLKLCLIAAGIILLLIYLTAPNFRRRGAAWRGVRFAHRGLHGADAAENSPEAFRRACEAGVGIELDVQFSKEHEIVVFHDPDLKRVCGRPGRVCDYTLAELKRMPLEGGRLNMPTLNETLNLVAGRVPLLVEIKTGSHNRELCEKTLARLRRYGGAYIVESFNPMIVFWFRRHAPEVLRGQLVTCADDYGEAVGRAGGVLLSSLILNFLARPDFIAYNAASDRALSPRLQRKIFHPLMAGWTIRDPGQDKRLRERGEISIFEGFKPEIARR